MKALLILGSVRDGRYCERVATFMKKKLEAANHEITVLDPATMDIPLLKQPLHFYRDRSEAPQILRDTNALIEQTDAFCVITAEYNLQVPPALSNLLDHFPQSSYAYRPCAIVSYSLGPFGGCRAAMMLRPLLSELGAVPIPAGLTLPKVSQLLSETGELLNDDYNAKAERVINQLDWYATAIKNHKDSVGLGPK